MRRMPWQPGSVLLSKDAPRLGLRHLCSPLSSAKVCLIGCIVVTLVNKIMYVPRDNIISSVHCSVIVGSSPIVSFLAVTIHLTPSPLLNTPSPLSSQTFNQLQWGRGGSYALELHGKLLFKVLSLPNAVDSWVFTEAVLSIASFRLLFLAEIILSSPGVCVLRFVLPSPASLLSPTVSGC